MGQFLDHDITLTPEVEEGVPADCCAAPGAEECFEIKVPTNDQTFAACGQDCLHFVRSSSFCSTITPVREQVH